MARGEERVTPTNDPKKTEQLTVLSTSGAVPEVRLPHLNELSNDVKGSALENNFEERPAAAPAAAPALYGMVLETKLVHCNRANGRVTLRAGKIISSKDYDLAHLAKQGLKMKKHEPEAEVPLDQIFVS